MNSNNTVGGLRLTLAQRAWLYYKHLVWSLSFTSYLLGHPLLLYTLAAGPT